MISSFVHLKQSDEKSTMEKYNDVLETITFQYLLENEL